MVQKYALYYTLQDEIEDKFELGSKVVDVFKMYINPMMYSKEKEILDGKNPDPAVRTNAYFEEISKSGRVTGRMPLTKDMQEAIAKGQQKKKPDLDHLTTFQRINVDDNSPVVVG